MKILVLFIVLFVNCLTCIADSGVKTKDIKPPTKILFGFKLCDSTHALTKDSLSSLPNESFTEKLVSKIKQKSFSVDLDIAENHAKSTAILLAGYYRIDVGIPLIIENLDHYDVTNKAWPSVAALANYGESAVDEILEAFEAGISGRAAANAKLALVQIKGKNYYDWAPKLQKVLSEKAYSEYLKYNTQ